MTTRARWSILTPPIAASGLLVVLGLGGAWYVHQTNRAVSDALDDDLAVAQSAERIVLAVRDLRTRLDRFLDTGDQGHMTAAAKSFSSLQDELRDSGIRSVLVESSDVEADGQLLIKVEALSRDFQQILSERTTERARDQVRQLIALLNEQLLISAESLLESRQRIVASTSRKNLDIAERVGLGLLLLGTTVAVAGLLTGFSVARNVHRSLVEISLPVRDIAGRLNEVVGPITISSNTDLPDLDGSLRLLAEKTADVVRRLQRSQEVSIRHDQLSAIGQLAAGLAHELRNPLMSIKLIVQTAAENANHSLKLRDLTVLEDEITRLEVLLQTFLDFARPPKPTRRTFDVDQLIGRIIHVVRPRASQQRVDLHFESDESLLVEADESQIRQLLLNLLLNALDVLSSGGNIWLDASVKGHLPYAQQDEAGSGLMFPSGPSRDSAVSFPQVRIRVADDGPGFMDSVKDQVFEPFVSTKETGIGLGLSISSQIVESHGGQISVRNREEGGAEVIVYLPLHLQDGCEESLAGSGLKG